jgi:replication factor A1
MAEEFVKIRELSPKSKRVNTVFRVVSIDDAKNVRSKRDRTAHAVTEAVVGDDSGVISMTLWDESLNKISAGKTYRIVNGYVTLFRGTMRLNIGKLGEFEEAPDMVAEVKRDNNMSQKVFDEPTRGRPYEGFGSGSFWP